MGLVIKSAAPLREESVAVFKSRVAASEGPSLLGAWEWPKPQNWRLSSILQSGMDIVRCLSQGLNLALPQEVTLWSLLWLLVGKDSDRHLLAVLCVFFIEFWFFLKILILKKEIHTVMLYD